MTRRIAQLLWLAVVWVALWGTVSPANVVAGASIALGLLVFCRFPQSPSPRNTVRPLHTVVFVTVFVWKLVESSFQVAIEALRFRSRISEAVVAVPLHISNDTLATIVANFITLTPGTLTIELDRDSWTVAVHVLHFRDVETVRADVYEIERLTVNAFGSTEARRAVAHANPPVREGER